MKYRDLVLIFVSVVFLLTLAFTIGVDPFYWFLPVAFFVLLAVLVYELWIK